ncbi:hypothetical protein MANES_09G081652v8 [Manihot esculenta]|uniref:Uncharacterized protein n=1 Tax=Manihot esculenta TaxID=3983 RepID=A0ACB7H673_MANES|nr:hypothetical protein MANES_09G081652v8 [Manihot esculenta]
MEGSLSHSINNRSSYQSRHNNNSLVRHVLQEDSNENEHEELYKVGEVVNDNNNCDEIELAGIDDAPSVGMYYASIDILFNAYLAYAKEKGFSVAKNYASKGNGNTEHNHELDPHMSRFMHAHKSVSSIIKRRLKAHDIAGIRPSKSVRLLEVQTRYPEKLSCLPRDCRNFVDRTRRLKLGNGDVDYINKMFLRMQRENANFFHLIDTDEDHKLTNVFWEHPWSIVAYEELNDVVSVNTTYLVNRYRMPFASIIGVNHHGQSILLGSTLISHKDAKSFKWVFSMWLAAVDQCESMRSAIREVMPNIVHRFCIWHILCKNPEKLRGVRDYDKAKEEFIALIYENLSPTIQFWVLVYVNHIFWAGMLSTQMSEGMHAYFDGYVYMSTLKQFVEKEFFAYFRSKNIVVNCISEFQWERQFQEAYTTAMFRQAVECEDVNEVDEEFMEEGFEHNKILERSLMNNWYVKEHVYIVLYKEEGSVFKCNCRKFESKGILCTHILKVITLKNMMQIHERYVLRRWRKYVYCRHNKIFFNARYPHMTEEYKKFKKINKIFNEAADVAMQNISRLQYMKEYINDNLNDVDLNGGNGDLHTEAAIIRNPIVASNRGPRSNPNQGVGRHGRGRGRGHSNGQGRALDNDLTQESHYQASNLQPSNFSLNLESGFLVEYFDQAGEN